NTVRDIMDSRFTVETSRASDPQAADRPAQNYTAAPVPTHVDPVCGMTIEEADAVGSVNYNGTTHYFCADSCLERFKETPDEFLAPASQSPYAAAAPTGARIEYTCPMDPQIVRDAPGACPICG